MNIDYKPRLVVDLTPEQFKRKQRLLNISQGLQRTIMSILLDDLLDVVEKHGPEVYGVLLKRLVKPSDILPSLVEAKKHGQRQTKKSSFKESI